MDVTLKTEVNVATKRRWKFFKNAFCRGAKVIIKCISNFSWITNVLSIHSLLVLYVKNFNTFTIFKVVFTYY